MSDRAKIALLLGSVTALVYARALSFEFLDIDDTELLLENPMVRDGLSLAGIRWAWTTTAWGNWMPLSWMSHQLDFSLFGVDPVGHHASSVLLHVLNTLLVFGIFTRLTGRTGRSALVAALFGLHPMRVESVAWIAERKDVLCAFFGLLTIWAYAGYARHGGVRRYALVALSFAAGLAAKSMLVTLPLVLLLLDLWPLRRIAAPIAAAGDRVGTKLPTRSPLRLLGEKVPLLALSLAVGLVTASAQASAGALVPWHALPLAQRLANAALAICRYLEHGLWPWAGGSVLYRHPYLFGGPAPSTLAIAGAVALLLLVSAGVARSWRSGYAPVGWLWFLGMLVPTLGLAQVGVQALADRYTYLPSIGLALLAVWGGADLLARVGRRTPRRRLAAGIAVALPLLLGAATWRELAAWRDSVSLLEHGLAVTGGDWMLRQNLGRALERRGRLEEAVGAYRRALADIPATGPAVLRQSHGILYYHLGRSLDRLGRSQEASEALRRAAVLVPGYPPVRETPAMQREGPPAPGSR